MGMFSYICPCCRTPINLTEWVHLRHIRHGEVLGETEGKYDGYGRVFGNPNADSYYRIWSDDLPESMPDYPNTHEEIWKSEYRFWDSVGYEGKIYEGQPVTWLEFRTLKGCPLENGIPPKQIYELWESLPIYKKGRAKSGTSAYHVYCWNTLTERQRKNNTISHDDPNQGCGSVRTRFKEVVI